MGISGSHDHWMEGVTMRECDARFRGHAGARQDAGRPSPHICTLLVRGR